MKMSFWNKIKNNKIIFVIFFSCIILFCLFQVFKKREFFDSEKQHFLSLCCIIKDELYLEEFIIYHNLIGVEHFYIYDNDSNPAIKEILNKEYYKKICTIIDFPGKVQQLNAYNDCLKNFGKNTKWLIFIDGDEFILPKKHDNLENFLKEYDDFDAIGINWMMFGSSFHEKKQSGFLIDKYRHCNKEQDKHVKSVIKPEKTLFFENPHFAKLIDDTKFVDPTKKQISGHFNENITTHIIQINHYRTKSIEEQIIKKNKGTPDRIDKYYAIPNESSDNKMIDDLLPNKYLNSVIKKYNEINEVNDQ